MGAGRRRVDIGVDDRLVLRNAVHRDDDDVTFNAVAIEAHATTFHTGLITVHARFDGATRTYTTDMGWPGERYRLTGPTPNFTGVTELRFRVEGFASALRYFAVVTTAPAS